MNEWLAAALVLIGALVPCLGVCLWSASVSSALVAVELAATLAVSALVLLSEGYDRQPFIDLALVLAVLAVLGGLVIARMLERLP